MREFRVMARLELINIFGFNEIRHTKNQREKKKRRMLLLILIIVSAMLMGYSGAGAYLLYSLGLRDRIPMVYFLMAFLLQLALGMIKARSVLYREKDLGMISALPVRGIHVMAARIFRMYVEGILLTLGILLPSMLVYGITGGAGAVLYLSILPAALVLPILPTAISAWIGILIAAMIARSRHKAAAEVLVTLILFVGIYLIMSLFSTKGSAVKPGDERADNVTISQDADEETGAEMSEEEIKAQMAETLKSSLDTIETSFPPAGIMGNVLGTPDFPGLLIYAGISLGVLLLTVLLLGSLFFRLSGKLVTVTKHHEYRLEALRTQSVMMALVKKEMARYTSSGIYMSNTIIGPFLAVAMSIALFFFDPEKLLSSVDMKGLPFTLEITRALPYLFCVFFMMVSISACSLSMEGKNWWLPKSLPLSARDILGAKLLFNLLVMAPFYGVMEIILLFSLRVSFLDRIWLLVIPGMAILFSTLFGMRLNLRFPRFHWDNATEVVKQGAAVGLSILGAAAMILPGMGVMILPAPYYHLVNLVIVISLSLICLRMYGKICRVKLESLEG